MTHPTTEAERLARDILEWHDTEIIAAPDERHKALAASVRTLTAQLREAREALKISDELLSKGHTGHSIPLETLRASFERCAKALAAAKVGKEG